MSEMDFIIALQDRTGCSLLLNWKLSLRFYTQAVKRGQPKNASPVRSTKQPSTVCRSNVISPDVAPLYFAAVKLI
jgi:hypothetical protein